MAHRRWGRAMEQLLSRRGNRLVSSWFAAATVLYRKLGKKAYSYPRDEQMGTSETFTH